MRLWITALVFVLSGPGWSLAQSASSIIGTVTDSSGAVLPGATVLVTNVDTGFSRTLVTDSEGRYRAANVPLGEYELRVEMSGFRTLVRRGISLSVGSELAVNFRLDLGEIAEDIVVTGEAPLVETSRAVMSGLVDSKQIENLPLSGRSYTDLALLQPGVVLSSTAGVGLTRGTGLKITIAGSRASQVNYTLDGSDINDNFNNLGGVSGRVLGLDAVREFRVVTSPYSAEYAKASGGEVQIVTRAGTNNLHGTLFEFHRNDAMNTQGFFDVEETPPFNMNQFGGSLGGPVLRDRTHFFAAYEGLRENVTRSRRSTVPHPLVHQGFAPDEDGVATFYGIDPRVAPYLALYPMPNGELFEETLTGDFHWTGEEDTTENYVMARVDQQITGAHNAYGRFVRSAGTALDPSNYGMIGVEQRSRTQYVSVGLDSVLGSAAVNTFQASYNQSLLQGDEFAIDSRLQGLFCLSRDWLAGGGRCDAPLVSIEHDGGGLGGSSQDPNIYNNKVLQIKNDLTLQRGSHSVKIGANISRYNEDYDAAFNRDPGNYSFDDLRFFLQGSANTFTSTVPGSDTARNLTKWNFGFYIQDDWRMKERLTLNLGLRYEPGTVPTEKEGRTAQLRTPKDPNATIDDIVIGDPMFENPHKLAFSPRVGFAWDLFGTGRTAIRGGAGIFFDPVPWIAYRVTWNRVPPFHQWGTARSRDVGAIDFPNAFVTQPQFLQSSIAMETIDFNISQPTIYRYGVGIQHELRAGLAIEAQYSGSRGDGMIAVRDFNVRVPEVLPDGQLFFGRNAPIFNRRMERIRIREGDSSMAYDGLVLGFRQRFRERMQFQVSYTLAKAVDEGSNTAGSGDFTNEGADPIRPTPPGFLDRSDNRGPAAFDVRQNLVIAGSYEIPSPSSGITAALLGGWTFNGNARLMSGTPFMVSGSRSSHDRNVRTWGQIGGGPPDLVPGADPNSIRPGNFDEYFDPSVFTLPAPGFFGNLDRNLLVAPGIVTVDFSVVKQNRFSIRGKQTTLQLRAEFFNVFNRVNFGTPSGTLFTSSGQRSPTAGRITSTSTRPREIQVGVRLSF
jgi:outer membrane receptor protein involved in Fe transport